MKKETLQSKVFSKNEIVRGDIITLCMHIKDEDFISSLKTIHNILNIEYKYEKNQINKDSSNDPLAIFKKHKRKKYNNEEIVECCEDILKKYIQLPHINLIREGIIPRVQEQFGIRYCYKSKRILFPHRYWSTGQLVGIVGRTTIEHYDLFDIPKYLHLKGYPKTMNLYGLYENYKTIQECGYVIVYEAEKSVLKGNVYGYPVGVSLGGHELSEEHIKILISLDVDIIIALDKDIDESISIKMCEQFKGIRNTYYIYDKYGLLGKKDSPIDKGLKIFKYLLKNKIKVG